MKHKFSFKWLLSLMAVMVLLSGAIVGCNGDTDADEPNTEPQTPEEDTTVVLTVTKEDTKKEYTMTDLNALGATESKGGILTSIGNVIGPDDCKGFAILDVIEDFGGLAANEAVRVIAKDGYAMTFSYQQLTEGMFTTFDSSTKEEKACDNVEVILMSELNGTALDEEKSGKLRLAVLSDNDTITEGHWWVKWVENIEIIEGPALWELNVEGAINTVIDLASFEAAAAPDCHGFTWADDQDREWVGIPLWILVGWADDENQHEADLKKEDGKEVDAFNDELAAQGYQVEVIAADGYSKTFASADLARNDNWIIAYMRDGEVLPENQWPLRLVGADLSKGQMVGQVVTIKIIFE